MPAPVYTELHARSAFSFLEGAALPEELACACKEKEMGAMAVLDRDGVYGAPRFYLAAKKASIKAHIGSEVTSPEGWRYPLLVASRAGYQNLCRLITQMKLRARKGEGNVSPGEIGEKAGGLVCLTGSDEGPLAHALSQGGLARGTKCVQQLCDLFGRENVYVELQRHLCREEEARNQAAIEIARKLHLPLLATNGVCYAQPQQREILDVFTCIRNHRNLASAGRLLSRNSERHLKTPHGMMQLFADLPEAIANTQVLSARLQFAMGDLGYKFPPYPAPDGETQMSFLRHRTREGMLSRYGRDNERAQKQVDRELAMIEKLDLAGYFLIVWDIVRFCREKNILVQGRGSAANSAVCYALGITAVDPVGMDLLFERFLSEERGEWPDIDLDLPSGEQRERAIQYVYERYGKLGAAMTANVITYRGRSAAREIGKALSFDPETLDRLAGLVGAWEYRDANDTLERQFRDAGLDPQHPRIRKFFDLCRMVQDLPRHLGQHSGGMVVCQGQLDSIVPLEPATMPGRVVVQWDKEDCADMGMVKIDLLGLGMMAVLEESLTIIRNDYGDEVDLAHLPTNDKLVYDTLKKADTVGMFQIESRAQMSCLPRLRPECFYDIVVQVAIIRPGPIVGQMVNPYLKRRQGREAPECLHPSLEPVLARTLGVPLFQEQLLRMAMIAAGFTGGEAEELRRAFGFKRSEARMKEVEVKLRRGMTQNGIHGATQDTIIKSITSFALYGFPESHAASFALLAYASAYLKCHYLAAFTAAMLNNQPMGFYNAATLVKDAQRHGLKVRPIDVTCSNWLCTLEKEGDRLVMRLGLRYVKGLRQEAALEILRQRAMRPFSSIEDLKLRVPWIQKSELAALASIGALNFISPGSRRDRHGINRRDALWQIERVSRRPGPLLERAALEDSELEHFASESSVLDNPEIDSHKELENRSSTNAPPSAVPPWTSHSPLQPMTAEERLVADFRGMGMTVGPHPMAYHRASLKKQGICSASELCAICDGTWVRIAGSVIARQRPGTAKGFVFLSIEDETGISNVIITPQLFDRDHVVVVHQQFLLIEGPLQNQDNVISVKAQRIQPLSITRAETASHDFH
ncbi:MAG TPA: error-prone DNA polymerase [Terriglobales bacterium]|jgi:error-prone DNA polymerase|nr:error-prone DNA polymerase [Terriglobales bacterium]